MCFKCSKCKKISPPKSKQYLIPIETRPKTYPIFKRRGRGRIKKLKQVGTSSGWEIVREVQYCYNCYVAWLKEQEELKKKQELESLNA